MWILDTVKAKANCGVFYETDATISNKVKVVATAPTNSHKPIIYPVDMIKDKKNFDTAKKFLDFT